jgi:acyl-CoA thioesterase-1
VLLACSGGSSPERTASGNTPAADVSDSTHNGTKTILALGTSLTAGLGLDPDSAWPAIIQRKVDSAFPGFTVRNAGLSGETSAGARRRIEWLLRDPADVVMIETGANDMLRGLDPDSTRANVRAIVREVKARLPRAAIVLIGMQAPPNMGADYAARFAQLYAGVAAEEKVYLVPFLLQGVAGETSLNQSDGIHPNAAGARIAAENVWRIVAGILADRAR